MTRQAGTSVVLFSGGRGSGALTRQLVNAQSISLTIAINGYDDGASTGEVRRFLGDALGPSDFRKNASRLARILNTCDPLFIDALDLRLPVGASADDARQALTALKVSHPDVGAAVDRFSNQVAGKAFNFSDCSIGNLVFAGLYLESSRHFNEAVDRYCALVGLPIGLIENVTDGTNAWLIGIDQDGRLLASEEEIVDGSRPNHVREIFLIDRPLLNDERRAIESAAQPADAARLLEPRAVQLSLNPRLAEKIAAADLIIYAPGTQHSSLFPSYLTPGLASAIAANLHAIKIGVTNIQSDAEITGSSAVNIIERAVFYLKGKGRDKTPTPCLITHYLINDPRAGSSQQPYVPVGAIDAIEDQRLVRIANYEDGATGQHDAALVLGPFLESIQRRGIRRRIAVLLHDAGSTNKVAQTLLEMVRGGIDKLPIDVEVFYSGAESLEPSFVERLPFGLTWLAGGDATFADTARAGHFDYVALFESSGMYRGENLVTLCSQLTSGRLDAVWGSRRLSVREMEASYRFRYHANALVGLVSYLGSYVLSLSYLMLYQRFVSDSLSRVRAVRASDAFDPSIDLTSVRVNHLLLARLLRRKADLLEIPVQFLPVSPESVKHISVFEGIRSLAMIAWRRFRPVA